MSRNRGSKQKRLGKLKWRSHRANKGRKPTLGKRMHFQTWPEVKAKVRKNATTIIAPPKTDEGVAKPAAQG